MSDDGKILEVVAELAIKRQIDEALMLAMLRAHPSKSELAAEVRLFSDDLLQPMAPHHQAIAALWINAILESLGESPGHPPE